MTENLIIISVIENNVICINTKNDYKLEIYDYEKETNILNFKNKIL